MSEKPATITAVAGLARVSPATVSRVMNGRGTVDASIAARVRAAAAQLSYSPSPLARSLALGRTHTVAVLVPDLANPTFQGMLRGVSRAAAADHYRVLVADSEEDASTEGALAQDVRRRTDAVVLCAPRMPDDELAELVGRLAPVVVVNRMSGRVAAPGVAVDYEAGIRPLLAHLHDVGHRDLVYLSGNPDSSSNTLRARGIAAFAAEHPDTAVRTLPCGVAFESGYAAADAVLTSGATAAVAFNDLVAMGLLSALSEREVAVPGELSVTGFDDITFARYTTPPLTTASVPVEEVGAQVWRRLHALVAGEEPEPDLLVLPRAEVRGSTGPPAGRPRG